MKKIILVDGNNLMFRSYFATAYTGNLMRNSAGVPTNALYGFANMINKIIQEEKPNYMAVAFDIGKNFRHEKYKEYKAGRNETPSELKEQMPKARDLLDAMGIKHLEVENYEADDIIGTLSKIALIDPEFDATIISSDKDLLQLINKEVDVKLLKTKGFIRYNEKTFKEDYGIDPIRMIDLKALMGDASDNVPGVKGIGEKTALKILQQYGSLESIYENIDNIKGSIHDKLVNDKESAFFSKDICTICLDVPLNIDLDDLKYTGPNSKLENVYKELEFYSLLKTIGKVEIKYDNKFKELTNINEINKNNFISYYIECDDEYYHNANILGMGLFDGINLFFIKPELISEVMDYLKDIKKITYDLKKNICLLKDFNTNTIYDNMIASYLLNYQIKDDLAVLMNKEDYQVDFYNDILKEPSKVKNAVTIKAKYIYDTYKRNMNNLKLEDMEDLFFNIEMPLIPVLAKMELNGIRCDEKILQDLKKANIEKLEEIANKVYDFTGEKFNISSPKQVGEVLFDHMKIKYPGRKSQNASYHTDAATLEKLIKDYTEIQYINEYRNLTKLNGTYLDGLSNYIFDGKIHTIYKQAITRTGRLSSADPNLQNIPTRDEYGKLVRKAFLPTNDLLFSADYSQIELRVLAEVSGSKELIDAFNRGDDIHTMVASDIFNVEPDKVTKLMRRTAKAVIFGIVYGISGFGLGENLNLTPKEAKKYIDKYLELYPGVKEYMDNIVNTAKMFGSVRTLYNRKRVIEELNNPNYMIREQGKRMALNTPIQGTSADIMKMAMIEIDKKIEEHHLKSKMILQVHDELIFDCLNEEKETLEKIVVDTMENIVKLSVPLKVSTDYGTNWYDAK